jgi:hypothetical protein
MTSRAKALVFYGAVGGTPERRALPATAEGEGKMPSRQPAGRRRYSLFSAGGEGVRFANEMGF